MSYILDALRKADAQRDRQRVPGLHDHAASPAAPGAATAQPLLWGVLAIGLLSVGLAAWQLWPAGDPVTARADDAGPVAASAVTASSARPASVATAPSAAPEPAPVAPSVQPPPVVVAELPRAVSRLPATAGVPETAPAASPAPARQQAARPAASAPAAAPAPAASASPQAAPASGRAQAAASTPARPASAADTVLAEAPADAPRVAINGGVYSEDAAQRMLVINGQVLNEGAEVAPGLVLERIRPNQAVLRWRGQRYALRY